MKTKSGNGIRASLPLKRLAVFALFASVATVRAQVIINISSDGQAAGNTYNLSASGPDVTVVVTSINNDGAVFIGTDGMNHVFDLNGGECKSSDFYALHIDSPDGSLRGMYSNGCRFSGDLSQVDLQGAIFDGGSFENTALTGNLGTASPKFAIFNGTTFQNTTLSGDLSQWNFDGVYLIGADLSGVTGTIGDVQGSIADGTTNFGSNTALAAQFGIFAPVIEVEQPVGVGVANGGAADFGGVAIGEPVSLTFTIKSTGTADLESILVTKDGTDPGAFTITSPPPATVTSGNSTTFTVAFDPATSGPKSAVLHIASNDTANNPYDINLSGTAYSYTEDTDSDGLNDASEFQLAALGFDPAVSQTSLVDTYYAHANGAGLFTPSQVQALHAPTPLIARDSATGRFKLTLDWMKSTDLMTYGDFPASPAEVTVNPSGDIEFDFEDTSDAAFFRLEVE